MCFRLALAGETTQSHPLLVFLLLPVYSYLYILRHDMTDPKMTNPLEEV